MSISIISLSGEKWRAHRKLIAPAFHQNVLKSFIRVFNNNSRAVVQRLEKEVGKEFDVHDHLSQTTVDILLGKFSKKKEHPRFISLIHT